MSENPPELYDEDAERDAVWCDRCGSHHGGLCPTPSDDMTFVLESWSEIRDRITSDSEADAIARLFAGEEHDDEVSDADLGEWVARFEVAKDVADRWFGKGRWVVFECDNGNFSRWRGYRTREASEADWSGVCRRFEDDDGQ